MTPVVGVGIGVGVMPVVGVGIGVGVMPLVGVLPAVGDEPEGVVPLDGVGVAPVFVGEPLVLVAGTLMPGVGAKGKPILYTARASRPADTRTVRISRTSVKTCAFFQK